MSEMDAIRDTLTAFGWEATDTFMDRYWTDLLVYNLTNALRDTLAKGRELESQIAGLRSALYPTVSIKPFEDKS